MAIVELNRLTKRYGKRRGIEELTFSIEEGEIFGFIGPNGAGKSTTIRLLLNLIHPTAGSAKVFGKDIVRDSRDIRRDTGYLPSEVHYYDDMKVADLLRYSAGFHGKLDENRMRRLAERLDLDLSRKIADLSFGNRKNLTVIVHPKIKYKNTTGRFTFMNHIVDDAFSPDGFDSFQHCARRPITGIAKHNKRNRCHDDDCQQHAKQEIPLHVFLLTSRR